MIIYRASKHILREFNMDRLGPILQPIAKAIGEKLELSSPQVNRVIGFIDGTFRAVARPRRNQRTVYSGHYRGHGYRFQSVVMPTGLIEHLYGPTAGRQHDSRLYWLSGIEDEMKHKFSTRGSARPYKLYGDPAYQRSLYLDKPFSSKRKEEWFRAANYAWARVRISVEWQFSIVTQTFGGLNYTVTQRSLLSPVGSYYYVCSLLTNICTIFKKDKGGNKINKYFNTSHLLPNLEDYLQTLNLSETYNTDPEEEDLNMYLMDDNLHYERRRVYQP